MENSQFESETNGVNMTNILSLVYRFLKYWYWFVISIILCLFIVKYYLDHTVSVYKTTSNVLIIDDSKNNFSIPTAGVVFSARPKMNLANQIEVLKSRRMLEQVVKNLDLNTEYYAVGYLNNIRLWKKRPFSVEWLNSSIAMENRSVSFEIEITNEGYRISKSGDFESDKVFPFNSVQKIDGVAYRLSLQVGTNLKSLKDKKFLIKHIPVVSNVISLAGAVKITNTNGDTDILTLALDGTNKDRSEAILNEIIRQFDDDGLRDRRLVYQKTIEFVNDRFKSLESELDSIETRKAMYKRNNELTFLESDAGVATTNKDIAKNDVFRIETQMALSKILDNTVRSNTKLGLLPTDIGVSSANVNLLVADFNAVVLERDRILVSGGDNNPRAKILNGKLFDLQKNILESIKKYQQELEVSLSQNNFVKRATTEKFSAIPINEKVLNSIERQRSIKEALYLLLLQKREEAAVNLAITSSSIKVVDYALTDMTPLAPKKSAFYLGALIVGLLIPFSTLYGVLLLDDKLHTKEDILKLTKRKIILSELPHIDTVNKLTESNDRSILGESFRILRTNLSYVFPIQKQHRAQTIMITSTIKGEGKTFTALNLSISFSIMNKKVLLVGADMRNPQLHSYLNVKKGQQGLQDYLHDISLDWHPLISKNIFNNPNLDIILSGAIPPNPAELLANGRLELLVNEAKNEYDIIIIDTPPTLLVTDTLVISHLADTTLYVVRADYTPKKILEFSVNLSDNGKLKNMAYVINNVGENYKGYGYGYKYNYAYGYGYGYNSDSSTDKSIFKRISSLFIKQ